MAIKNELSEVGFAVRDYLLYSEVEFYSRLPFSWMNTALDYKQSDESYETRNSKDESILSLPKSEVFSAVGSKIKNLLGYYYYTSSL